jgi:chromosome segregation ATPase
MPIDDSTQHILDVLVRLEAGQTNLRAEFLAELGSTRGAVTNQLDRLEDYVNRLEGQVNRLEDHINRLNDRADRLESGQTSLRTEFLAELGNTRSAIMDRVDRLENRITEIRDDIEVAMGSTDAAQRVNDNTRADLRTLGEQVGVMWKQIKRLESRVREITGDP